MTAGIGNFCALGADQSVRCWGSNQTGQLGLGDSDNMAHPAPGMVIADLQASLVRIQSGRACAITASGLVAGEATAPRSSLAPRRNRDVPPRRLSVSCWGQDDFGSFNLPNGDNKTFTPVEIQVF